MVNYLSKPHYDIWDLVEITHILRSPGGCPWDQAQDHQSIRRNFLEETYEVCEALDNDDLELMKEELGDVLLQVVFHADIERDRGRFTFDDVCDRVCKKLIFRHPHVFGGDTSKSWEDCKALEKGQETTAEKLGAVARSLPSLWRAEKMVNKAKKNGACWPEDDAPAEALLAAAKELSAGNGDALGKVLFAAAACAAKEHIDPEAALPGACETFLQKVGAVEQAVGDLSQASREEQLSHWPKD